MTYFIMTKTVMNPQCEGNKPGIEPRSPALQADSLTAEPSGKRTRKRRFTKSQETLITGEGTP